MTSQWTFNHQRFDFFGEIVSDYEDNVQINIYFLKHGEQINKYVIYTNINKANLKNFILSSEYFDYI
jgi:hypothetical protein